jgi:hypothetical protein
MLVILLFEILHRATFEAGMLHRFLRDLLALPQNGMVHMAFCRVDLSHAIMLAELSNLMGRQSLVGLLHALFVI